MDSSGRDDIKDVDKAWELWQQDKTQPNLSKVVELSRPIIDKAMTSYAPSASPSVKSYGKILTVKAVQTFDPTKGTKFQTYLHTQLQPLRREAYSYDTLHVPERVRMDLGTLYHVAKQHEEETGMPPSDEELADRMGISMKRINHLRTYQRPVLEEFRTRPKAEEDAELMPSVEQESDMWEEFVYQSLGSMDQRIYDMKMGKNGQPQLSVSDIAKRLKVSPSAVSQRLTRISNLVAERIDK